MALTKSLQPSQNGRRGRRIPDRKTLQPIGDVARNFGVTLRTLRFYEDKGLLTPYREGNSRLYSSEDREKLSQILKGKQLGFTLGEIRDLIATESAGNKHATLSLKPEQIRLQIDHLERQRNGIDDAIAQLRAAHARLASTHVG